MFDECFDGGGGLATRRRSSSGHLRICVSGGCRVESDGVVWAPVSGRSRSCSLIETIASESETIESFRRGSRIREAEHSRRNRFYESAATRFRTPWVIATTEILEDEVVR